MLSGSWCAANLEYADDMNPVKSVTFASIEARVGFVTTIEEADEIVAAFEEHTTSKFVTSKQKKTFGKNTGMLCSVGNH